jgi:hypothetical protein
MYFTTFVHSSPHLPPYKYQGEVSLIHCLSKSLTKKKKKYVQNRSSLVLIWLVLNPVANPIGLDAFHAQNCLGMPRRKFRQWIRHGLNLPACWKVSSPPAWKQCPAGVICAVLVGPYRLPCRTVPAALKGAAQQQADGICSCCYIANVHNHPSWCSLYVNSFLVVTLVVTDRVAVPHQLLPLPPPDLKLLQANTHTEPDYDNMGIFGLYVLWGGGRRTISWDPFTKYRVQGTEQCLASSKLYTPHPLSTQRVSSPRTKGGGGQYFGRRQTW